MQMFQAKERLESKCILHVQAAAASPRLEHSMGEGVAAQLRRMGFHATTEEACPNSGYNLDVCLSVSADTPPELQPPAIDGHRGWVLEVDRPSHYLAGSRTRRDGRWSLRAAHLTRLGYTVIVLPHWEWTQQLALPDDKLQGYLHTKLVAAFRAAAERAQAEAIARGY